MSADDFVQIPVSWKASGKGGKEPDPDGSWQKVYDSLTEHAKLLSTSYRLGTHPNMVGFGLIRIWKATRLEREHGRLIGWRPKDIVAAMGLTVLLTDELTNEAIVQVLHDEQWLDLVDGEWAIHNWSKGQRTGAKIEELSKQGSHGNHIRYDQWWPDVCGSCAEHGQHIDDGDVDVPGCHVCAVERRGGVPTKGDRDVRDLSPEGGSPEPDRQSDDSSP